MTERDTFAGERLWEYGAGERWTAPPRRDPHPRIEEVSPRVPAPPPKVIVPERRVPKNYERSQERIREDACERLLADPRLELADVSVEVKDGIAILEGTVPHRWMKHRIEDIAAGCFGVKDLTNKIRVVPPAKDPLPDEFSAY
jgi:hypothetical protein